MKKQAMIYFGFFLIGISCLAPAQAEEQTSAAQLQAAIQAFGVSAEQAEKAAAHSIAIIEDKEKDANSKSHQDMQIVSDDFFTISPY